MQTKLIEPRLWALFETHVRAAELQERLQTAVAANQSANTTEFAELMTLANALHQNAARLIIRAMRMQEIGQQQGYEAFCEAVNKWGETPPCNSDSQPPPAAA